MSVSPAHASDPVELPGGLVLDGRFFDRPADVVARDLIGKVLWSRRRGGGRLSEVEAYLPENDPACHAACGFTKRNAPMFGPPGTIYVFLSYGVHHLLNLVCDQPTVGSAVLIRSFEPLPWDEGGAWERSVPGSSCGPGRVGKTLGIHPALNGLPLGDASGVFVLDDGARPEVAVSARVGISRGQTLPLRYYMEGSRYVTGRRVTTGGRSR